MVTIYPVQPAVLPLLLLQYKCFLKLPTQVTRQFIANNASQVYNSVPTGDQVLTGAGQVPVGEEHFKDGNPAITCNKDLKFNHLARVQ